MFIKARTTLLSGHSSTEMISILRLMAMIIPSHPILISKDKVNSRYLECHNYYDAMIPSPDANMRIFNHDVSYE